MTAPVKHSIAALVDLQDLPPIPEPKGWTDDLERAWVFKASCGTPYKVAGAALGIPVDTIDMWLSDEPPVTYQSACHALLTRLKRGEAIAHDQALDAVRAAWGKAWQSAAWFLERKHGYIVQQPQGSGPSIVVNIGRLELTAGARRDGVPVRQLAEEAIVEAQVTGEGIVE